MPQTAPPLRRLCANFIIGSAVVRVRAGLVRIERRVPPSISLQLVEFDFASGNSVTVAKFLVLGNSFLNRLPGLKSLNNFFNRWSLAGRRTALIRK
jgi:hypothetical protein